MAKEVKLVGGKFVATGKETKVAGTKPPKYPYPSRQYDDLLKIAKADGVETGDTRAKNTGAVNTMTGLIIDAFLSDRAKAKI